MKTTCEDRENIFLDGTPEEWAGLEQHATTCADCARELGAWKNLSVVAQELRAEEESPVLWGRIRASLQEEAIRSGSFRAKWWRTAWTPFSAGLQTALAAVLVLAVTISIGYLYVHGGKPVDENPNAVLLKSPALREVEKSERAYERAIEQLEVEAKPQLEAADSPLISSYREKLLVLDGAIKELRLQAGVNPSNAHLRRQLLAMYQEKQQTLEEIRESKR